MNQREKRILTGATLLKLEDRGANGKPKIAGYAAVFDSLSEPIGGQFREKIRPGAFRKSLASGPDVCALVDHDPAKILGRKSAGTLSIVEDKRGLYVEIDPPDTTYGRDVVESMRRGDITGMSFGFTTVEDDWINDSGGEAVRELREVDVFDVSVVTYPAYPDTEVALRSFESFKCADPLAIHFKRLRISDKSTF